MATRQEIMQQVKATKASTVSMLCNKFNDNQNQSKNLSSSSTLMHLASIDGRLRIKWQLNAEVQHLPSMYCERWMHYKCCRQSDHIAIDEHHRLATKTFTINPNVPQTFSARLNKCSVELFSVSSKADNKNILINRNRLQNTFSNTQMLNHSSASTLTRCSNCSQLYIKL